MKQNIEFESIAIVSEDATVRSVRKRVGAVPSTRKTRSKKSSRKMKEINGPTKNVASQENQESKLMKEVVSIVSEK